jgi:hypothetical protein
LPLLIGYELLAAVLSRGPTGGIRNGADVLLEDALFLVFGRYEPVAFAIAVIGPSLWLVTRDLRRGGGLAAWVFGGMLAESCILGALFGTVVGVITADLLHLAHVRMAIGGAPLAGTPLAGTPLAGTPLAGTPLATRLMLALGAGIYEELLFRVLLVSGIAALGRRAFGWRPGAAGTVAVLVSATIFAAFHYVGPYGDPLRLDSFLFRLLGGIAFSALYIVRGFGITAWTHALYDILVLVA